MRWDKKRNLKEISALCARAKTLRLFSRFFERILGIALNSCFVYFQTKLALLRLAMLLLPMIKHRNRLHKSGLSRICFTITLNWAISAHLQHVKNSSNANKNGKRREWGRVQWCSITQLWKLYKTSRRRRHGNIRILEMFISILQIQSQFYVFFIIIKLQSTAYSNRGGLS